MGRRCEHGRPEGAECAICEAEQALADDQVTDNDWVEGVEDEYSDTEHRDSREWPDPH